MNVGVAALGLLAAVLAAVVAAELQPDAVTPDELAPARTASASAAPASLEPPTARTAAIAALLARPLFSGTRRPPNAATPTASAPSGTAPLPRMTAIVIDGSRRSAIFAAPGGKPVIVSEGGQFGAYTVRSIAPREVVVVGPDGSRVVRTTFDPNRVVPSSPFVVPGGLPVFPPNSPGGVAPIVTPGGRSPDGSTPFFLPPTAPGVGNGAAR